MFNNNKDEAIRCTFKHTGWTEDSSTVYVIETRMVVNVLLV